MAVKKSAVKKSVSKGMGIDALIDALYKADSVVEKARRVLEAAANEQTLAEEAVTQKLQDLGLDAARGKAGGVEIKKTDLPHVKDWPVVYKYITKNDAFDLLEKRISRKAWHDRNEDGTVPGIEVFVKHGLKRVKSPAAKVSVSKPKRAAKA